MLKEKEKEKEKEKRPPAISLFIWKMEGSSLNENKVTVPKTDEADVNLSQKCIQNLKGQLSVWGYLMPS